ncbi:metal ABC transporter ATP-binding protein [Phototrophicus methaneseepsis]|uniref:Metal ABC transporter ATP-binding protein n=1 Tax=Phototrophicus methaneseepsis TaxID=2710758 RepID=A0A7S8IGY7_9CHLR|nr:metal ABC transporter ATP-binding protein [Phototrophicus methaneseepsis]QPC84628.1 metal ABC transporter ATP-binding protein [Phototrophicus methaneseepsis]
MNQTVMKQTVTQSNPLSGATPNQTADSHTHHQSVALNVHNLSAGYPGDRQAISNIQFAIKRGERVAIIGPNGAGKSTLFKAIAGLIPFTTGEISVQGEDCRSSHAYVGYVPQQQDIDWTFPVSVYDVIMMGRARHSKWFPWWQQSDHERTKQLLAQLSLTSIANRQIGELSGGQKRRVFIARALAQEASVLLMDEPFTGVDTTAEQEIMETLDVLRNQGITILLATHNLEKAASAFDKILLLKQQQLAYGPPSEIMQPDVLRLAFGGGLSVFQQGNETIFIADEHGANS